MDKLLELEKVYFSLGKTVFKFNEDISSNIELNADIHYEISKYLGKSGGLLNKLLRKKWLERGIYVEYGDLHSPKFPNVLLASIYKISVTFNPRKSIIEKLKILKEVEFNKQDHQDPSTLIGWINYFGFLDKIYLEEKVCKKIFSTKSIDKNILHKIFIITRRTLICYQDYLHTKEKHRHNFLALMLKHNITNDLNSLSDRCIMFHDIVKVYIGLYKKIISVEKNTKRVKISVIINNDSLQIDYCLNFMKKLYLDLGIDIELDIFAKKCNCHNLSTGLGNKSIYDSINKNIDLTLMVKKALEN